MQLEECYGSTNLILAPLLKALQVFWSQKGPTTWPRAGLLSPPFLFMLLLFSALDTLISFFILSAHPTPSWVD